MIDFEYSLEHWLQDFSKREQAILALRTAARVFPAIARDIETGMHTEDVAGFFLPHFRQLICGFSFCYYDETPLENALKQANRDLEAVSQNTRRVQLLPPDVSEMLPLPL